MIPGERSDTRVPRFHRSLSAESRRSDVPIRALIAHASRNPGSSNDYAVFSREVPVVTTMTNGLMLRYGNRLYFVAELLSKIPGEEAPKNGHKGRPAHLTEGQ